MKIGLWDFSDIIAQNPKTIAQTVKIIQSIGLSPFLSFVITL